MLNQIQVDMSKSLMVQEKCLLCCRQIGIVIVQNNMSTVDRTLLYTLVLDKGLESAEKRNKCDASSLLDD